MKIFHRLNTTFNPRVVGSALLLCLLTLLGILLDTEQVVAQLLFIKNAIFAQFSWFFISCCAFFVLFLLFLALSRFGDIKLGRDEDEPEFRLLSWYALLFTAGIGIGILYLGVAEPLFHQHSHALPSTSPQTVVFLSIFHWGLNTWAIYAPLALAIAYFGFRYKLPLSLRSCFYPLLKQRINGGIGDLIDSLGLCATLFGLITTLSYAAIRLADSLEFLSDRPTSQWLIHGILFGVLLGAIWLSRQSLKGLRILSEVSFALALLFMLVVLLLSPTAQLLSLFTENLGIYLSGIIPFSFKTYVYQTESLFWFYDWTVFYWAWWLAWSPAFGIFIARISKGRTIREFIFGVLVLPTLFFILWFSIFGNGAILLNEQVAYGGLYQWIGFIGKTLFAFLDYLPLSAALQALALLLLALFFLTTIDFGIYTLNNIASRDKSLISPRWQAVFWGALITLTSSLLFYFGGVDALQAMMLLFALPFAALMLLMCASLLKGLHFDYRYSQTDLVPHWTADNWRSRLPKLMQTYQGQDSLHFLKQTALPALRTLRQSLIGEHQLNVHLDSQFSSPEPFVRLTIYTHLPQDFVYTIVSRRVSSPESEPQGGENSPNFCYRSYAYLPQAPDGEEVQTLNQAELIVHLLQKFEQYLQTPRLRLPEREP